MPKKSNHKGLAVHWFRTQVAFLNWLDKSHEQTESVWLKFAKKASQETSLSYEEAREAAIIYGWIDGLINGLDEDFYLIKFSLRRPKSLWSKINRGIAQELIKADRMKPSGMAQVNAAKKDGRWKNAYSSQRKIKVPTDLQKKLDNNPKAKQFFESISKANRYAFLYRIENSKKAETRVKHIEKTMKMLSAGEVYHPKVRKSK